MLPAIRLSAFLLGTLLPFVAHAQWQFSAGTGLRHAQVTEFAPNGQKLVTERGWLPGLRMRAEYPAEAWRFAIHGDLHAGDIDYDGRLQGGAPFRSDTGTSQIRIGMEAARQINPSVRLVGGIEWDYWKRNIKGHSGVLGLDERYSSYRLLGGAEFELLNTTAGSLQAKTQVVVSSREKMRVRFDTGIFDDARLSTKTGTGIRLGLAFVPAALPKMTVGFEFDWLRVPRSVDGVLRQSGTRVGSLAQPEHVRRAFDVYLSYRF